jgi:hypothetical protein
MNVKQLIEALSTRNPEDKVYVYSEIDKGGDEALQIYSSKDAIEKLYFNGDAPWGIVENKIDHNFVVIG